MSNRTAQRRWSLQRQIVHLETVLPHSVRSGMAGLIGRRRLPDRRETSIVVPVEFAFQGQSQRRLPRGIRDPRSQTKTDSRPVGGAANGRLIRQAIGPLLTIFADCRLSLLLRRFGRIECGRPRPLVTAQSGSGRRRPPAASKPGLAGASNGVGFALAAAQAPNRRTFNPNGSATESGHVARGLEHATSGSDNPHRHQSYAARLTSHDWPIPVPAAAARSCACRSILRSDSPHRR